MANSDFTLPDVGEGLTEAEIVSWKVKPGDTVIMNQVLVEIETAKSLVELPSPFAGTVSALLVEEGQTVEVGTPIITVSSDGADVELTAPAAADESIVADTAATVAPAEEKSGAVLVGYGVSGHGGSRRRAATVSPAVAATPAATSRPSSVPAAAASPIIAKPPIRKLAKDLGVDLATVVPTGLAGEITRDDVIRLASQASAETALPFTAGRTRSSEASVKRTSSTQPSS